MPLHYILSKPRYTIALWNGEESLNYFYDSLGLSANAIADMQTLKPFRQVELLSTRHLLNYMLADKVEILKNQHGKPYINQFPNRQISLSHSGNFSAVMLSDKCCGLDIQLRSEKIRKIAPKFIEKAELMTLGENSEDKLHFYWGIKESVFKAWGKGGVDFKEMISVEAFEVVDSKVETTVTFAKGKNKMQFKATGRIIGDVFLSFVQSID